MTSRLSTFPNKLMTSSFTASNIPASNLPSIVINTWLFCVKLDPAHSSSLPITYVKGERMTSNKCPPWQTNINHCVTRWHKHFYLQANKFLYASLPACLLYPYYKENLWLNSGVISRAMFARALKEIGNNDVLGIILATQDGRFID